MTGDASLARPAAGPPVAAAKPKLVVFHSPRSGQSRRVEGYIAQTLQRRHNHETFDIVRVSVDARPDLARRFRITDLPTLLVVEDKKVERRVVAPRGCRELERELSRWLR
jgi:hypothetical protein